MSNVMTIGNSSFPQFATFFNAPEEKTYRIDQNELNGIAQDDFHTHGRNHRCAEIINVIAQALFYPARIALRLLAYSIEPLPGKDKDKVWTGVAIRIASFVGFLILIVPTSLFALIFALPLHICSHSKRSTISYVKDSNPATYEFHGIHMRTHNLGLVHECMGIVGDLRPGLTRAKEIANWLLEDESAPNLICLQEVFHTDAKKYLINKLRKIYPHIIHSIDPKGTGFDSGVMILSQLEVKEVTFRRFTNMHGLEKHSPRGVIGVRLNSGEKEINVYVAHLQALLGKKRAEVRVAQIEQIVEYVKADQQLLTKPIPTYVLGDFNITRITAWGEINHDDEHAFELLRKMGFKDLFAQSHDEITGVRTEGSPTFVEDGFDEASGSWYTGPFHKKGFFIKLKECYERCKYHTKRRELHPDINLEKAASWGTSKWIDNQTANTSRFDYIFEYQGEGQPKSQEGDAQIRRVGVPPKAQSAPSDHLPVDFWCPKVLERFQAPMQITRISTASRRVKTKKAGAVNDILVMEGLGSP